MDFHHQTITITFGDRAENHVGMQKIGKAADIGFSIQDIEKAKNNFELMGCKCEIIALNAYLPDGITTEKAQLLIIKNGVDKLLADVHGNKDNLFQELKLLDWDTKAKMYGRVVNKHARYNLCLDEIAQ